MGGMFIDLRAWLDAVGFVIDDVPRAGLVSVGQVDLPANYRRRALKHEIQLAKHLGCRPKLGPKLISGQAGEHLR